MSTNAQKGDRKTASMIRIVFLISTLNRGGAEKQLTLLARGLDHSRFYCFIVTIYDEGELTRELDGIENVEVLSVRKGGKSDRIPALWRLARLLRSLNPDIVHGYLDSSNVLALITGKLAGAHVVWGVRSASRVLTDLDLASQVYQHLGARLSAYARLIIANSTAGQDFAKSIGYPSHRVVTIPNGFETDRFLPDPQARSRARTAWGIVGDTPVVGIVARLDPVKDHPNFLRAAALLVARMPDVRFVCVGGGSAEYERELKQLAESLSINDHVVWAGETADMPAAHNGFDVATLVSTSEGLSNAIGEAMSCAVPCVVTDVGDSAELVKDTGIAVQPGDPGALCEAWQTMLKYTPEERMHLGEQARMRILEHYSVESLVGRTTNALLSLIEDPSPLGRNSVTHTHALTGTGVD